jgi:hypothetical protein
MSGPVVIWLECGEPVVAKVYMSILPPDTRKSSPVHAKTQPSAKGCGSAAASTVKVTRQSVFWSVRSHNRYPGCSVKLILSISWRTEEWSHETARKRNKTARTAREQVGPGKSGMGRIAGQLPSGRVTPPLQFKREYQHREFGLPVRLPWRVHPSSLQIIEIDGSSSMSQAADIYDSRRACPAQQWHQPSGESKVPEIICSKLRLEAIRRGLPAGQRHHSRIVDQEIKGLPGVHSLREGSDRCKAGQINRFVTCLGARHLAADLLDCRLSLLVVAAGQYDLRTGFGQCQGRLVTKAAGGSRNYGRSAKLRRDFGLCQTSHGGTLLKIKMLRKLRVTFGPAGSEDWWGGSARYQSRGRRYCGRPRTAGRL